MVQFDLGLQGLAILLALSLGFGLIAQLVAGRATTRWLWLIGAVAWFVGGLFGSEVVFATATEADLQPMIDGLAFDEALLFGLVFGLLAVAVTWIVTRRNRPHHSTSS